VLEIDQPNVRVLLSGELVPVRLGAIEQLQDLLVDLHQAVARRIEDLLHQLVELSVRQSGLRILRAIDVPHRHAEHIRQHDFAEAASQTLGRIARESLSLIEHLPPQGSELNQKRLFDEVIFGHSGEL
jgi:hypothetical protein